MYYLLEFLKIDQMLGQDSVKFAKHQPIFSLIKSDADFGMDLCGRLLKMAIMLVNVA